MEQETKVEQEGHTFTILRINGVRAIRCDLCTKISYSLGDIAHHYCGSCHVFHDDLLKEAEAISASRRATTAGSRQ